jgi:hypothetical protein
MKKILLIAYSYPPLGDAQSLRWYYLSNELAKIGYLIDVITIKHPSNINKNIDKNITIHRVFPGFFENIAYKLKSKIGVDNKNNEKKRKSFSFKFMKSVYWFLRNSIAFILPGNITTEWYFFVKKYMKSNINIKDYEYLITSHEPWVDSLIGLNIKSRYPDIKWIGDFGDPYVSIYTPKYKLFFENIIENKIYKNIDLLVFTNNKVLEVLETKYKYLNNKNTLILEQGFKDNRFLKKEKNSIFTIVYTGTFYDDFRNPKELAKALLKLDFEFKFIVAGRNEKFNYLFKDLGSKYEFLGFKEHDDVLKLQRNADLLIHLSNKQLEQVPGKFYEYIGSNIPILMIYQNCEDQLIKLTKKLGCGAICKNSSNQIYKTINQFFNQEIELNRDENAIEYFSWESRAKVLKDRIGLL